MTTRLQAAAWLIDTTEDRLLDHRDYGDRVVVIGPDGKKFSFTDEQIKQAIKAMRLPTLKEAAESRPEALEPKATKAQAPKPRKGAAKREAQAER